MFGELPALSHGRNVGTIIGDDRFEDVECFCDVVGFGDGQDEVLLFSAGHRHVQAAAGGGRCGQGDADGLGVGLVAGLGRGVAEADVTGGQGDGAVSANLGHGQIAASADVGDCPQFAVANTVAAAGVQLPIVAAGGDNVTNEGLLPSAIGADQAGSRSPSSTRRCWMCWLIALKHPWQVAGTCVMIYIGMWLNLWQIA